MWVRLSERFHLYTDVVCEFLESSVRCESQMRREREVCGINKIAQKGFRERCSLALRLGEFVDWRHWDDVLGLGRENIYT